MNKKTLFSGKPPGPTSKNKNPITSAIAGYAHFGSGRAESHAVAIIDVLRGFGCYLTHHEIAEK